MAARAGPSSRRPIAQVETLASSASGAAKNPATRQTSTDDAKGERQEFDGSMVDVETFVIEEGHALLSSWRRAQLREIDAVGRRPERARARARETSTRTKDGRADVRPLV